VAGLEWRRGPIAHERKIEFRLLGPLEVLVGRVPASLGPPQQRALLALLLLDANEVVSRDRLVDDLWGEPQRGRSWEPATR
jgi:DNA-binding SARP family transcriptional activator